MKVAFVLEKIGFSLPLGLAYLSGALKKSGHTVRVFKISGHSDEGELRDLLSYAPQLIGYSVITGTQKKYLEINKRLKERLDFYSVFGGPHATFYPQIINEPGVDVISRGESELAFTELADFLEKYRELPEVMENLWVKKGQKVFSNSLRPLISNLDSLPFADHRMFVEKFGSLKALRRREFIAHRGCPYSCSYCFNPEYNRLYEGKGPVYRARQTEDICAEINFVRQFDNFKFVHFVDDVFTLDEQWVSKFSAIYRKEVGLPFSANMRLDNCTEQIVASLKDANCYLVQVGVETGSEALRSGLLGRDMTNRQMAEAIELLRKYKIKIIAENILGFPSETYESCLETLKANMELGPDFANASVFNPYPGLKLTEYAVRNNYFSGDFNSLQPLYYRSSPLFFRKRKESGQILNLRCFFSLLCKHSFLLPVFKILSIFRYNRLYKLAGDLLDGFYLHKLLPYRFSPEGYLRLLATYICSYRN